MKPIIQASAPFSWDPRIGVYRLESGANLEPNWNKVAKGGEATVYRNGDVAFKHFMPFSPVSGDTPEANENRRQVIERKMEEIRKKIRAFPAGLPHTIVAPYDLVLSEEDGVVGFLLPFVSGKPFRFWLDTEWQEENGKTVAQFIGKMLTLYDTLCALHLRGIVVGDLKPDNLIDIDGGGVALIDVESMHLPGFPAVAFSPEWIWPKLCQLGPKSLIKDKPYVPANDWHIFNAMLVEGIFGIGPYGGTIKTPKGVPQPSFEERALDGLSVFASGVRVPPWIRSFDILNPALRKALEDRFSHRASGPVDRKLLEELAGLHGPRRSSYGAFAWGTQTPRLTLPQPSSLTIRTKNCTGLQGRPIAWKATANGFAVVTLDGNNKVQRDGISFASLPPTASKLPLVRVGGYATVAMSGRTATILQRVGTGLSKAGTMQVDVDFLGQPAVDAGEDVVFYAQNQQLWKTKADGNTRIISQVIGKPRAAIRMTGSFGLMIGPHDDHPKQADTLWIIHADNRIFRCQHIPFPGDVKDIQVWGSQHYIWLSLTTTSAHGKTWFTTVCYDSGGRVVAATQTDRIDAWHSSLARCAIENANGDPGLLVMMPVGTAIITLATKTGELANLAVSQLLPITNPVAAICLRSISGQSFEALGSDGSITQYSW